MHPLGDCDLRLDLKEEVESKMSKKNVPGWGRTTDLTVSDPETHRWIPDLTAVRNNHYATKTCCNQHLDLTL